MTDFNLPANLDINNHRDLPGLVKHGIRSGFITTAGRETVRQVARLVGRAQADAIPDSDLLIVLAAALMKDRPEGFAPDWHPYQVIVRDLAWAMCSSSIGLNNTLLAPLGHNVTLEDHVAVAKKFIEEEREKRAMTDAEAKAIISGVMDKLSPLYPDLGLSFGYIGNIWHSPYQDDRSFRVFTKLRDRFGYSVNFGQHSHARLGELAFLIRAKLEDWCAEQRALLAKGEHRTVGLLHAA